MKFTQISSNCDNEGNESLYALGEDGFVYLRNFEHKQIFTEKGNPEKGRRVIYRRFWDKIEDLEEDKKWND